MCHGGQSATPLFGGVARTPHTSPTLAKRRSHHLDTPPTVKVPGTPLEPARGFKEEEQQQVSRRAVYLDEREIELTRRVFRFAVEESAVTDGGVTSREIDRMAEFQNPSVSCAAASRPTWSPPLKLVTPDVSVTRPPRTGE